VRPPAFLALALLAAAGCAPGQPEPVARLAGYEPATPERLRADGWRTDLDRSDVPLASIHTASLPRDAFVPIEDPEYAPASELDLDPAEPVVVVRSPEGARGWPLVWLLRRELVLDDVDGVPVAVSFCSLCATARVWDRRVEGETLDLAVSGLLREGNSLLWDRATESLWSQLDGRAIVGARTGTNLASVPSLVVSFGALRRADPAALVMRAPPPGPEPPVRLLAAEDLARGEPPAWLHLSCPAPLEMMIAIGGPGAPVPVRGEPAEDAGPAVVFRDSTCAAPFRDRAGRAGPRVGAAAAFRRDLDGRHLTFRSDERGVFDRETGSRWNALGEAVEGPLAGRRLAPFPHAQALSHAFVGAR